MRESLELERWPIAVTYLTTSSMLASAWLVQFPGGLWLMNAISGVLGLLLARRTLGQGWLLLLGYSKANLLRGVGLGLLLVVATQLLAPLLLPQLPLVSAETQRLYGLLAAPPGPLRAAPIIWLVVFAEEFVYRGVVTSYFEQHLPRFKAVIAATLLYVLPLAASRSFLLVALGLSLGTCLTVVKIWSRSLLVPLIAHCLWSCATFVAFPLR